MKLIAEYTDHSIGYSIVEGKSGKKKNVTAVITNKFNLYIDGTKLDKYSSQKEAEKAVKEFIKLMGA